MAGSGPQKYPGASLAHWYQDNFSSDLMEVNVCVLHSTEGVGLPSYDGGSMAPNLTAVADFGAKRLRWHQHFDVDRSSRALQNLAGGVQTNTLNVVQVELDGTCDYSKRKTWGSRVAGEDYIYWGDPPDWALQDLADFLRWLQANHNVPLTGPDMWLTYGPDSRRPGVTPASYGASPARMSFAQWNAFKGICGHEHVPENVHGDPGSLPFATLIALAKGTTPPTEDDMAITDAEWKKLEALIKTASFAGVVRTDGIAAPADAADVMTNPTWQLQSYIKDTNAKVRALLATEVTQTAAITALAKLIGSGVDTATVVTAVQQAIADAVVKVDVSVGSPTA